LDVDKLNGGNLARFRKKQPVSRLSPASVKKEPLPRRWSGERLALRVSRTCVEADAVETAAELIK
jgi:hypothetical protein